MTRPFSALLLAALALPATALTLGGGGDARPLDLSQTYDFAANPADGVGTYVATQAEGKLKGVARIGIVNMCVQFVNSKSASGLSSGGSRTYTRSAEGAIPGGLDEAKMQAIADQWLEKVEADLRAAGFELLPYEELAANDLYQKYAAKFDQGIREAATTDRNNQKGDTGEAAVYVSPKGRPFSPDCGTISPQSTSTFVRMAYPLNAEFLTIRGVIDMGQATSSGGLLRGARADIQYAEFLRAGDSQFQFVGKTGPGARVWLKQSIVPRENPFTLGDAEKGKLDISSDTLGETTTVSQETTRAGSFDEGLYFSNAGAALDAMHRLFLAKIAEVRK